MGATRRKRASVSCSNCRQRKTKCDRQLPCGRCRYDKRSDTCFFEGQDKVGDRIKQLEDLVNHQKDIIENKAVLPNTPSTLVGAGSTGSTESSGVSPLHYNTSYFNGYMVIANNIISMGPTSFLSTALNDVEVADALNVSLDKQHAVFVSAGKTSADHVNCYNPNESTNVHIKDIGVLPKLTDVRNLLNFFFSNFGGLVVFLDRHAIVPALCSLLEDRGDHTVIRSDTLDQASMIASLLLLLRMAYMGYEDRFPIDDNKINVNESYGHVAATILMSLESYKNFNLARIHGLLILRTYFTFCPESDDLTAAIITLNAVMVQAGRALGLNRHVDDYPHDLLNETQRNNWYVSWVQICYYDCTTAFDKGLIPTLQASELEYFAPNISHRVVKILETMFYMSHAILLLLVPPLSINFTKLVPSARQLSKCSKNTKTFDQISVAAKVDRENLQFITREALLKLDILHKESIVNALLYQKSYCDDRVKYQAFALEKSLILVFFAHKVFVQKTTLITSEIDKFISPKLWMGVRMCALFLTGFIAKCISGQASLFESLKYFESPDSPAVISWLKVSFNDEKSSSLEMLNRLKEIYKAGSTHASKYYSAFKACMFLRNSLIRMKEMTSVSQELEWDNMFLFEDVVNFWTMRYDVTTTLQVESFFSSLNSNLDYLPLDIEG